MPQEITLPKQSESTRAAAKAIGAPCAVLVSVNMENGNFEARCYGENDGFRYMADRICDVVLDALGKADLPDDWEQALATIQASKGRAS